MSKLLAADWAFDLRKIGRTIYVTFMPVDEVRARDEDEFTFLNETLNEVTQAAEFVQNIWECPEKKNTTELADELASRGFQYRSNPDAGNYQTYALVEMAVINGENAVNAAFAAILKPGVVDSASIAEVPDDDRDFMKGLDDGLTGNTVSDDELICPQCNVTGNLRKTAQKNMKKEHIYQCQGCNGAFPRSLCVPKLDKPKPKAKSKTEPDDDVWSAVSATKKAPKTKPIPTTPAVEEIQAELEVPDVNIAEIAASEGMTEEELKKSLREQLGCETEDDMKRYLAAALNLMHQKGQCSGSGTKMSSCGGSCTGHQQAAPTQTFVPPDLSTLTVKPEEIDFEKVAENNGITVEDLKQILKEQVGCITEDEMRLHLARVLTEITQTPPPPKELGEALLFTEERFRVLPVDGETKGMIVENASIIRTAMVKGFVSITEGKFLSQTAATSPDADPWFLIECQLYESNPIQVATNGDRYYIVRNMDENGRGEAVDMHILERGFGDVDKRLLGVAIKYYSDKGGW